MEYDVERAAEILERTPRSLDGLLRGLPDAWAHADEGPHTWSPFVVVGHLIEGERHDWIPRARLVLAHGDSVTFEPFDRFSQLEAFAGRALDDLLDEFAMRRAENVAALRGFGLEADDLARTGRHPEFGLVTLRQHLATWVAHDLAHVVQVARTLARALRDEVGPWRQYLSVLG